MDKLRGVVLGVLAALEYGLEELDAAHRRLKLRRFLKQHPDAHWRYPDGESGN